MHAFLQSSRFVALGHGFPANPCESFVSANESSQEAVDGQY